MASATTTLYAWVVPAAVPGAPVDHTWVTDFDNRKLSYPTVADVVAARKNYWFCWGIYHPTGGTIVHADGALASQRGDLSFARCLVAPNADSRTTAAARGTIFTYGVDGVCHQLANQVLYATGVGGKSPLTVVGARGYAASTFIYGTYGRQHAAWATKKSSCAAAMKAPAASSGSSSPKGSGTSPTGAGATPADDPDDFAKHASTVLKDDPETLSKLLSLRGEVQSFVSQKLPGLATASNGYLNARNQMLINEAARLLGPKKFAQIFGHDADEEINLIDPTL